METRLLKVNFALCVICITALLCATGFADIVRTWKIHIECTDNVESLSTGATSLLTTDDTKEGQDDVSVCVKITKGATDSNWVFDDDVSNDGKVLSTPEEIAFDKAAAAAGKDSFRLVEWAPPSGSYTGFYAPAYGIAIMDGGNDGTLAHEIGHVAGCTHVETTHRIMYHTFSTTICTVSSSEKDKYEAIN